MSCTKVVRLEQAVRIESASGCLELSLAEAASVRSQLQRIGGLVQSSALTRERIERTFRLHAEGRTGREIARELGVSEALVSMYLRGERTGQRSAIGLRAWWTPERLRVLEALCARGLTYPQIAREMKEGLTAAAIERRARMHGCQRGGIGRPRKAGHEDPARCHAGTESLSVAALSAREE
jgi:DNA-binding NarL/FixJ family response regulator